MSHLTTTLSLQDLPGAVLVYDSDGKVLEANAAACELLGVEHHHLIGTDAGAGWVGADEPGERPAEAIHPAIQAARSRRAQRGALARVDRPDGSTAWVLADATPTLDSDGAVRQVVASLADVTPLIGDLASPDHGVRALSEMTQQMTNARLGPESIISAVTSALSRMRPGTWIASLINKDPRTVHVVAANDRDPLLARYVEDMNLSGDAAASTISAQVIENGGPVLIPSVPFAAFMELLHADVRSYMAKHSLPAASRADDVSVLVVPMRARGATIGTLGVFAATAAHALAQADVGWLQTIADRTGLAAENAQLYADAVRRLERLTALRNIGLAIAGSPDLRLTLQVILDQVMAGLKVDAVDLLVLDEAGTLMIAAQAGFQSTSVPDYRLPVDEQLPGRVLSRPHVEVVIGGSGFSQFKRRTLFAREGFRAYCAAPMVVRNRVAGVLEVFQRSALQPDDEWLGFLEALASYTAIALDSANMLERLQKPAAPGGRPSAAAPRLSSLEKQILSLLVEGTTNGAIAEAVHLSQSTVKFHVRQILQKVGAGNRTELARTATREGWL